MAAQQHKQERRSMPTPNPTSPLLHGNPAAPTTTSNSRRTSSQSQGGGQADPPAYSFPATLAIIQSFADLGYSPPPLLLRSLMPGICCQQGSAPPLALQVRPWARQGCRGEGGEGEGREGR